MSPAARRRVLIIVENLPVPFDTRVWNEATTLRSAGYEVSVICPATEGFEARFEVIDGVFIYRHPLPSNASRPLAYIAEYALALFWEFRLALRVLRERGFDVVHACNPPDTMFLVGLLFKILGRKRFVFDHHDLSPELFVAKFGRRGLIHRLLLGLERATFRVADVAITTNESYRRVAVERAGMDPERIWVVRSGPKLTRFRCAESNAALRDGRTHLVGYVGVMARQDGVDRLLEAAHHIVCDLGRRDVHFNLVGTGPEFDALRAQSAALGIDDYVMFHGRVSDDDLAEVLATADVCVAPDEVNELNDLSTMNKVMEYMAAGKPIVQFESTEGRVSAQDASLYARPGDPCDMAAKILELLADPDLREKMGALGRERFRSELAWDHQAPALLAAYDAVFGSAP